MASRYFLVYSIFTSCTVAGQSPKYALKGLEVKLKSGITRLPDDILWKHEGNKVVEFNGNEQRVYSPYEDRITLDWHSAELDITNLRYEDSGEYVLEAYVKNVLQRSDHQLEVIDKVASPTISCEMNDGSSSDISGKLVCSAEPRQPQSLMKFEWSSHGNVQMVGPNLNISLGEKHDDEVYNCTVSNPLSSETATFTAKNCYPADNSSSVLVIVGAVLSILLLLGIGIGIFFYMRHRKGSDKTTDQEDHEDEKWPLRHSSTTYPLPQGSAPIKPDNDSDDYVGQSEDDAAAANKHLVSDIIKQFESHSEGLKRPQPKNRFTKKTFGLVKEADEDEEAQSPHASAETSPAAQPRSPLAKSSPNMTPKDAAGEHEAESDPDQVAGETVRESEGSTEGKQSSTVPEQKGSETSVHEQDSNLSQEETHIGESKQQEPEKTVSEDENELDRVGDSEEKDMEENLRSTTYPLPQSSTPTKPDNINTFQGSRGTAHAEPDPDAEGQSRHDSGDYVGQSDEDTAAANKHLLVSDIIKQYESLESHNERLKRPQPKNRSTKKKIWLVKEADEDEEAQFPHASAETSPAAQPRSPLAKSSPNMTPKDAAGEHEAESDPDQVAGETVRESEGSTEGKQSSTVPEQKGSETSVHEQDSNLSQEETHIGESNQQEPEKTVSEDENELDCVGDEEKDMEENLRSTTYPLPQSSTPTKPDNINTFQRSPDTAHAEPDPDAEGQSRHDSGDYVGQSDEDTAAANKHLLVSDIIKQFESHNERLKRPQPKNRFTKKTFDEDEEAQSPLASAETSPAAQPRSCLTKSSLNEHKEGSDSDQDTEEAVRESEDSTKEKQSSTVPEQKGSETSLQEQDSNSDETEGQLESSTPEADNGQGETVENEVQCGPKEELDNKSLTDEGQKKGEDVE